GPTHARPHQRNCQLMDAAGRDQLFAYADAATLASSAPPKGRAMRCTVLGFTSNLAAVLRTLMPHMFDPARVVFIDETCTNTAMVRRRGVAGWRLGTRQLRAP